MPKKMTPKSQAKVKNPLYHRNKYFHDFYAFDQTNKHKEKYMITVRMHKLLL